MNKQKIMDEIKMGLTEIMDQYTNCIIDNPSISKIESDIDALYTDISLKYKLRIEPGGITIIGGKLSITDPNILDPQYHLYIPICDWVKED